MIDYSEDYLLDKRVKVFQPIDGYRASSDAVLLAAAAHNIKKGNSILDVGSGTGAISLCLADRFNEIVEKIVGLEVQAELAELANLSAKANNFDRLTYINSDIFAKPLPFCSFDHVFSNPPYFESLMPTSPKKGKATAHTFGDIGLEKWIDFCIKMIKPQGYFYMINRAEALSDILNIIGGRLGEIQIYPLYSKEDQKAKRVIIRARKDSKAPLVIAPPLIIHSANGKYTNEAEAILRGGEGL